MRKRKRNGEYGSYCDEDTGEVTTVQTNKQAKRAHQKSGKWYKEPTEAELRAWDRDEKRQALADRAVKKEENKKINAAKRAEKERKEEEAKRQMFQAGKITFTQTLAKKDEDQMNLHSWFGGRRKLSKSVNVSPASVSDVEPKDKRDQSQDKDTAVDATGNVSRNLLTEDDQTCFDQTRKLSQERTNDLGADAKLKQPLNCEIDRICNDHRLPTADQVNMTTAMDLQTDQVGHPEFEVLEDDSAMTVVPDQDSDQTIVDHFKVPALPNHAQQSPQRLPLSPMSPSDVNVRNFQTTSQVSSFKARLEDAKIEITPSTQAVRDILSGICTQDLVDDVDDFDKENDEPDLEAQEASATSPVKSAYHSSPLKNVSSAKVDSVPIKPNESFNSITESVDYDSIFFELDVATKAENQGHEDDDFDDCGLDDATLLSLPPATQLISSAEKLNLFTISSSHSGLASVKAASRPLTKSESFALDGLEDDDLLAEFNEYERSQNKTISTLGSHPKRKRVLPWDRPGWSVEMSGTNEAIDQGDVGDQNHEVNNEDEDVEMSTQDTEIISTFG